MEDKNKKLPKKTSMQTSKDYYVPSALNIYNDSGNREI